MSNFTNICSAHKVQDIEVLYTQSFMFLQLTIMENNILKQLQASEFLVMVWMVSSMQRFCILHYSHACLGTKLQYMWCFLEM